MKRYYNHIKIIALIVLVGFLFAFSSVRNAERKISEPIVKFLGEENLFVTHATVSKLLIVNQETVTNKPKEIIDLNDLESALNSNPMIKQAQVYINVDGQLTAEINQKKPIARVATNASYYIDDDGTYMPLSTNYSARVPLVTGFVEKNNLYNLAVVARKVQADEFLKNNVVEIHQNENKSIDLRFRKDDFTIQLGSLKNLDKKINNLKAFYQKAMRDSTLNKYSVVNLRFDKQVICTKK
ncbi:cell division protein FtsQ/DivIB [Subsaxibacter sp. CAU 1640]|uniref:cell division protein FtsQ/DivIB n=1 Tax=Subsaxibacter sp. CAU 1640 TaxID=2933271 RepID=UPI0020051E67|nr:cell division protein FtsQ/DivIB [Subsaxibacter sp. CAU 1640]MCK7590257.1 cell division protein FtsQ/DivIB [Subsaxibacter sp. CAU 1640]